MNTFLLILTVHSIDLQHIPLTHQPPSPSALLPFFYSNSSSSVFLLSASSSYLDTINLFSLKTLTWTHQVISSDIIPPLTRSYAGGLFQDNYYLIGGLTPSGPSNSVWVFSTQNLSVLYKQWSKKSYSGSFPNLYAAGFSVDNPDNPQFLYILGGFNGSQANTQLYRYKKFRFQFLTCQFSTVPLQGTSPGLISALLLPYPPNILIIGGYTYTSGITYNPYLSILNLTSFSISQFPITGSYTPRSASGYIVSNTLIFLQGSVINSPTSLVSSISLSTYQSQEVQSQYSTIWYSSTLYSGGVMTFGGQDNDLTNRLVFYSGLDQVSVMSEEFLTPAGRVFPVVFVNEQSIYVFGGENGGVLNDMWQFDIETEDWSQVIGGGDVPSPRRKAAYCVEGNMLFVFGGEDDTGLYRDLYYFAVENLNWKFISSQGPSPRSAACMVFFNQKLFIYGGKTGAGVYSSELWMFDLHLEQFFYINSSSLVFFTNECFVEDSELVIVSYNNTSKFLQFFDMIENIWLDSVSINLSSQGAVHLVVNSTLITIGGVGPDHILNNQLELFNINTNQTSFLTVAVPVAYSAAVLYSEFLYILSGLDVIANTVLDSIPSQELLKLNLSSLLDATYCSRGTVLSEGSCQPCPNGHYSVIHNNSCQPCPMGTFSRSTGANSINQCKNCNIGSWNNQTGQAVCRDCPSNYYCPYGSTVPINPTFSINNQSTQPSAYNPDTALYEYSSSLTIYLSLSTIVLLFFSFVMSKQFREKIHLVDVYTMKHNHKLMVPIYMKKTTLGGICTILFLMGAVNFVIIYLLKFYMNNLVETRSLVPLVTVPSTFVISAEMWLCVQFTLYGGKCNETSVNVVIEGIVGNVQYVSQKVDMDCFVQFTCTGCSIDSVGGISIGLFEENSFASGIVVNFTSTSSIPNAQSSVLNTISSDPSQILTGNVSSTFTFELTPTILILDSSHSTGYHINGNFQPVAGSQAQEIEFIYDSQVSLHIGLNVVSSCLEINRGSGIGLLELFSALIGTVFGLLSSVGGILSVSEKHLNNVYSWMQHKSMLNYYRTRVNRLLRIIKVEQKAEGMNSMEYAKSYTEIEKTYLKG